MAKDYYQTLGIKKGATPEEIKKAYHRLAHQHHPDKGGSEAKFKEINEAYQVLSDKEKRSQYDQFGRVYEGVPGGGAPGWGFNWSWGQGKTPGFDQEGAGIDFDLGDIGDVFEEFFGSGFQPKKRKTSASGRDIELGIELSLAEILKGQEKEISLEKLVKCERCQGSGAEPGSKVQECFSCRGTGEVQQIKRTFLGSFTAYVTCPECKGEGRRPQALCNVCKGEGRVRGVEKTRIFIPAGVDNNQVIKVEGRGDSGKRNAKPGDLYVRIFVKSHPVFERKGDDLLMNLEVSYSRAVLGGNVEIEDLAGQKIILTIPAGSKPGKVLRLSGKGIPHFQGRGSGNLYIRLDVKVPQKVSQKQKELLEKLQEFEN